jgi:hypothetical protein
VEYLLKRSDGLWRIHAPLNGLQVSAPTLRSYVLIHLRDDLHRHEILHELDSLNESTVCACFSTVPPTVMQFQLLCNQTAIKHCSVRRQAFAVAVTSKSTLSK